MKYSNEMMVEYQKITKDTISQKAMLTGMINDEPLIVAFDSMLRYAKAYEKRFEDRLNNDYYLGEQYLQVIVGLRNLLNSNGAVANERDITTDSKDNGALEAMFWHCMEASGFKEEDI